MLNAHVRDVCRIGQGHACCRYLIVGPAGFCCEKGGALATVIDARVFAEMMTARGDNCDGQPAATLNEVP